MATCKECLHVEVCKFKDLPAPLSDSYIRESECIEKGCSDFKDRSRFVELPCEVGDSYFEIEQYCTERGFYNEPRQTDIMDCEYCDDDGVCDRQYRITEKRFISLIQIFDYKENAVNRYNRIFLTKEEAEQALKEHKNEVSN